jgi:hypothetical protein
LTPSIVTEVVNPDPTGRDFGQSSCYADFNGDGLADLAVGSPGDTVDLGDGARAGAGRVRLYVCSLVPSERGEQVEVFTPWTGPSSTARLGPVALPKSQAIRFGAAMCAADIDGNGIEDLVVAAPGTGEVYVTLNPLTPDAKALPPPPPWTKPNNQPQSTSMVINNQGLPSKGKKSTNPNYENYSPNKASIGAPGLATASVRPELVVVGFPELNDGAGAIGVLRWYSATGTLSLEGPYSPPGLAPGSGFGSSIASCDDDGDGLVDVYVGAPHAGTAGQVFTGMKFYGNCGIDIRNPNCPPVLTFETISAPAEFGPNAEFGASLAVCADGTTERYDLVIGAPNAHSVSEPDVVGAIAMCPKRYPNPPIIILPTGPRPKVVLRLASQMQAADVAGDGNADLIVTIPNRMPDGTGAAGTAEIWYANGVAGDGAPARLQWQLLLKATPGADVSLGSIHCHGDVLCNQLPVGERINWDIAGRPGYEEGMVLLRDIRDAAHLEFLAPNSSP